VNLLSSSSSTRLSTERITRQKYFSPMENHVGPHKNDFRPIKNKNGPIMTKTVKRTSKQFQPIRKNAWASYSYSYYAAVNYRLAPSNYVLVFSIQF
jgi:hypothetical protein